MKDTRLLIEIQNAFFSLLAIVVILAVPLVSLHIHSKIILESNTPSVGEWPIVEDPNVVIPETAVDQPELQPRVIMYSREGCPPCLLWWTVNRPAWQKKGWPVEKKEYSGPKSTPWFYVCDGEKEFEVNWLTYETYKKAGGK
jgi:hypothetical protein